MRTMCGLVLLAAVGCGGAQPTTPDQQVPLKPDTTPRPDGVTPPPSPSTSPIIVPPPPAPPAAAWELDPAKHTIPAAAAAGSVAGKAFAPAAEIQADSLTLRTTTKEGIPDRVVNIRFSPDLAKRVADGVSVTVRPADEAGAKVPVVSVEVPGAKADSLMVYEYPAGYGLTLELGKRAKGVVPGKVYLSLPGEAKDFVAGTFAADWIRPASEPPGPDDAPFVQGNVTVAGAKADTQVQVGYVGVPKPGDLAIDSLQMPFVGAGLSGRSDFSRPRVTVLVAAPAADKAARYEHTHLPAGKYLVFASSPGAAPVGKWVAVPADGKITLDLVVDPGKAGKLDVKVPAGATGKVLAVPADDGPVSPDVFGPAASAMRLEADAKDGVAKFDRLAPGRYEIRLNDLAATADVKLNETAAAELVPPKK